MTGTTLQDSLKFSLSIDPLAQVAVVSFLGEDMFKPIVTVSSIASQPKVCSLFGHHAKPRP
jgi:hypothetical protein